MPAATAWAYSLETHLALAALRQSLGNLALAGRLLEVVCLGYFGACVLWARRAISECWSNRSATAAACSKASSNWPATSPCCAPEPSDFMRSGARKSLIRLPTQSLGRVCIRPRRPYLRPQKSSRSAHNVRTSSSTHVDGLVSPRPSSRARSRAALAYACSRFCIVASNVPPRPFS